MDSASDNFNYNMSSSDADSSDKTLNDKSDAGKVVEQDIMEVGESSEEGGTGKLGLFVFCFSF